MQVVTAIGIRPARTHLEFETTQSLEDTFWVVNNDEREMSLRIDKTGELAEYVTIRETGLNFREDTDALPIHFRIDLPNKIPPGESTAVIIVEESLPISSANTVSSRIILKHKIIVQGPYPDKFITVKLNFHEREDNIELVSEIENKGKNDLKEVQTIFYVNDKSNQQRIVETERDSLNTKEVTVLKSSVERELFDQGEYEVSSITVYDGDYMEVAEKMIIGKPEVDITYFDQFFTANQINEYNLELFNKWNKEVENVFVDVEIKKDGEKVDGFRTKTVDIEGETRKQIQDYFDGTDRDPDEYMFEMVVNFWDNVRMASKVFEVTFLAEEEFEEIDSNSLTGGSIVKDTTSTDIIQGIVWGSIAISLAGLVLFLMYKYGNKGKKEENENDDEF